MENTTEMFQDSSKDYYNMTVSDLRKECTKRRIKRIRLCRKEELVSILQDSDSNKLDYSGECRAVGSKQEITKGAEIKIIEDINSLDKLCRLMKYQDEILVRTKKIMKEIKECVDNDEKSMLMERLDQAEKACNLVRKMIAPLMENISDSN